MAKKWRSVSWARDKRDELYLLMGGACQHCGETEDLQFDHITPTGWVPSMYSWSSRIVEYRRAHAAGNLQLLCDSCHSTKTRSQPPRQNVEEPF